MNEALATLYQSLIEDYLITRNSMRNGEISEQKFLEACASLLAHHKNHYETAIFKDYKHQ